MYYIKTYQDGKFQLKKEKKKICILTLENREEEYIFQKNYESELPIYWHKLLFCKEHLPNYDYILWLDSDTIIYNPEIKIESLLNDKHVYIGTDYPYISSIFCPYNSGIFIIQNSKEGSNYLNDCIKDGKYVLSGIWAGMCYEQGVMNHLIQWKYKNVTKIIPPHIFTSSDRKEESSFILHLFGKSKKKIPEIYRKINGDVSIEM